MEARRDLRWLLGGIVGLNLLLALGAIGLFTRMGPAIERILEDNVASLEAAEAMLAAVARGGAEAIGPFEASLTRARGNITEAEEIPILNELEAYGGAALSGSGEARARVVEALEALGGVNRGAMAAADEEAQRLGVAGAWVAAVLALILFVAGRFAARRFEQRVAEPLRELDAVLSAARRGDARRRCRELAGPAELVRALAAVNALLDARQTREDDYGDVARLALVSCLDARPGPAAVVAADGTFVCANAAALAGLAGRDGVAFRRRLARASHEGRAEPLGDGHGWLVELGEAEPSPS